MRITHFSKGSGEVSRYWLIVSLSLFRSLSASVYAAFAAAMVSKLPRLICFFR